MFAFALADESTGELVLARDPLGIKPLYYLPRGEGVVFASELKALVAAVGSELRIEPGALVASMLYYWVPEQQCAIEGVRKLPPRLVGALPPGGQFSVQQYWGIADVAAETLPQLPRRRLRQSQTFDPETGDAQLTWSPAKSGWRSTAVPRREL